MMCELTKTDVKIDNGFKKVHLNAVVKALLEHCGVDVASTQTTTQGNGVQGSVV
jgi:hypothetical protein